MEKQLQDKKQESEQMEKQLRQHLENKKQESEQMEQKLKQQLEYKKQESDQMEQKLRQQLEKRIEEIVQKEKSGLVASNRKELDQMNVRMDELKDQLNQASDSKLNLIQCTNNEINRLNRVINTLLQSEKCKTITRLLLDDSTKHCLTSKNSISKID